ncbi:hypothetical protein [Paenibacillus flagellatus]|uniref:Uncharacterized protein n=1 Tax=Paenibacillus flagellatus TaxID=2211139 RepID=A0A2V5K2N1_9BACL|nr:hypothetical protein [Paenibacillus flagellatus]PYI53545.1 hypothetical protein DLM86_17440 [Paenibacillus flagellatus]
MVRTFGAWAGTSGRVRQRDDEAGRAKIVAWLNDAFTARKAAEVADGLVVPSGGGYITAGGFPSLLPPGPVQSVKDAKVTAAGKPADPVVFTATYVLSGTHDGYLTCTLLEENGSIKIDDWTTEYK